METFARNILNGAQSVEDGGIIGDVLRNVRLINNTRMIEELRGRVGLRLSGGYVAAMVAGAVWGLIMILVMAGLCYLEFKQRRRPRGEESPRRRQRLATTAVNLVTKIKAGKSQSLGKRGPLLQLLALVIVMVPLILLLVFAVTNVAVLASTLSSDKPVVDYDKPPSALLPALKVSLYHLRSYLSTFADKARNDTKDTVEEIIAATKKMQNETMTYFNKLLMTRLGVTATFTYGDEMTRIVVSFFKLSTAIIQVRKEYTDLKLELFPTSLNRDTGLYSLITLIRNSFSEVSPCDSQKCRSFKSFFQRDFQSEDSFPDTDFASSFLYIMKSKNETPEAVEAKSAHGRRAMAATMAKTKARMELLVDIPGTIRNMTSANWDKMDSQLSGAVKKIDDVSLILAKSSIPNKVSSILAAIMILPVLLTMVVMTLTITLVCDGARNRRLRLAVYGSLMLLFVSLIFATFTFLLGGQFETELCRYLRTEQPVIAVNDSRLVLDLDINRVLPGIIRSLPKSDSPTPLPHNVLFGLIHRCRHNEPILVALDAIKTFDTRSLSKPEASEKIVAIGRMLMLESLNETDPTKMMPSDMAQSLNDAAQLDMFSKVDFTESLANVPRSPLRENNVNATRPVPLNLFIDRVEKYLMIYGPHIKNTKTLHTLQRQFKEVMTLLQRFSLITNRIRSLLIELKDIPKIEPVVQNLKKSLTAMVALMKKKPELLAVANRYYDRVIVSSTPENSAKIMANFGPKMMSQLGFCRPLFEAYRASVDTVCDVVVSKVNVSWLYLGAMVLLLTCSLCSILLISVKTPRPQLSPPHDLKVSKPLVSLCLTLEPAPSTKTSS